jgi:hypothetical protein
VLNSSAIDAGIGENSFFNAFSPFVIKRVIIESGSLLFHPSGVCGKGFQLV